MKKACLLLFAFFLVGCGRFSDFSGDEGRWVWSNALSSVEIRSRGEIELSEDGSEVMGLAPGARLLLRERRLSRVRELEITAAPDGTPQFHYEVGGRQSEIDDEARRWMAAMMLRVARETHIGAAARARRILSQNGPDALLDETEDLESSAAAQIYIRQLVERGPADPPILQRAVRVAARTISSSSRLRKTLVTLAESQPQDSPLTVELMEATEEISSSSESRKALAEIVRRRPLDAESAIAMARAIGTISSSSERRAALEELSRAAPPQEDVFSAILRTIEGISSSSEQRRALISLIDKQTLSPFIQSETAQAVRRISSNSERLRVLERLAEVCSTEKTVIRSYLDAVESMSSSSSQGKALTALLQNRRLNDEALEAVLRTAQRISSRSVRERVSEEIERQRSNAINRGGTVSRGVRAKPQRTQS